MRGINLQAVTIQKLNCNTNTTVVTMGTSSRLEDVTVTCNTSANVDITAISFPSTTPINAKLRTIVINATSTAANTSNTIGVLVSGTTSNSVISFNALQRCTINTTSSANDTTRGVLNNGSNYFSVRDCTIFATGTGNNCVAVETTNPTGYTSVKTSTVSGGLYDIMRTSGTLLLNATDLQNGNSDGNGFTTNTEASRMQFGTYANTLIPKMANTSGHGAQTF